MASKAIVEQRTDDARYWLHWSQWFNPQGAESSYLLAKISRREGNTESMTRFLKSAYQHGYDKEKLELERDLALATIGRLDQGVEDRLRRELDNPMADFDEIADAFCNGLTTLSRFNEAIDLLNVWSKVAPRQPIVNYRRARIHEHFHQADEAEQQYRESLSKDARFFKASYHLARVLLQKRQPDEAMKYYQQCDQGESALAAQVGIANCYRTKGDLEMARDLLRQTVKRSFEEIQSSYRFVDESPERFLAASELGCIETELGEFDSARQHLEEALKRYPLDSVGRYSYAVSLRGLGMKQEAEENFARTRAARTALDEVSALQETLRQAPENTEARLRIGKTVLEHESERAGVFWIQSVFSYDPSNQEAHRLLAEYFGSKTNQSDEDRLQVEYHKSFLEKR